MRNPIKHIQSLFFAFILIAFASNLVHAQSDTSFTPHGKPFALIFSNVNYTANEAGNSKAFEVTRAYLGYEYSFSKKFYSRINIDFADPGTGNLQFTAFLKNAFVQYKTNIFSARAGMISTDQFSLQESQWGYRYIYMSFQDAYKFGSSADLGAALEYSPAKIISFDFAVLNGEGYKKIQADSAFKTTFGVTFKPFKGFLFRGYYDRMKHDYAQTSTAFYASYCIKKFRSGLEYNLQKNHDMVNGNDYSGISVYASLGLAEKFSVFARYDYLQSAIPDTGTEPWNKSKDGQLFITGFDYSPVIGVKISPTYSGYAPYDTSLSFTSRLGLYLEIKF